MRENFRAWAESLETFVLEVIFDERHDFKARLMRGFLFGSSKIFTVAVKLRRWLYNFRILRDKTLGVQVIAINSNGLGSHRKFQERDHYPFALISDFYGDVIKAYGFWDADERKSHRGVVVVGRDGKISYVMPHFNPGNVNAIVDVFTALGLV